MLLSPKEMSLKKKPKHELVSVFWQQNTKQHKMYSLKQHKNLHSTEEYEILRMSSMFQAESFLRLLNINKRHKYWTEESMRWIQCNNQD